MKQLLLSAIACCAVLVPIQQADAKSFGGFKPKKTFTFKVKEKISAVAVGFEKPRKAPVPPGLPNFNVGQKVTFRIGPKGQLMFKGGSMPFKADGGTSNVYAVTPSATNPSGDSGLVFKNSKNQPIAVSLSFARFKINGMTPTTNTVNYTFEKR